MAGEGLEKQLAEKLVSSLQLCHSAYCVAQKLDSLVASIEEEAGVRDRDEARRLFRRVLGEALRSLNTTLPDSEDVVKELSRSHFRRLREFADIVEEALQGSRRGGPPVEHVGAGAAAGGGIVAEDAEAAEPPKAGLPSPALPLAGASLLAPVIGPPVPVEEEKVDKTAVAALAAAMALGGVGLLTVLYSLLVAALLH